MGKYIPGFECRVFTLHVYNYKVKKEMDKEYQVSS